VGMAPASFPTNPRRKHACRHFRLMTIPRARSGKSLKKQSWRPDFPTGGINRRPAGGIGKVYMTGPTTITLRGRGTHFENREKRRVIVVTKSRTWEKNYADRVRARSSTARSRRQARRHSPHRRTSPDRATPPIGRCGCTIVLKAAMPIATWGLKTSCSNSRPQDDPSAYPAGARRRRPETAQAFKGNCCKIVIPAIGWTCSAGAEPNSWWPRLARRNTPSRGAASSRKLNNIDGSHQHGSAKSPSRAEARIPPANPFVSRRTIAGAPGLTRANKVRFQDALGGCRRGIFYVRRTQAEGDRSPCNSVRWAVSKREQNFGEEFSGAPPGKTSANSAVLLDEAKSMAVISWRDGKNSSRNYGRQTAARRQDRKRLGNRGSRRDLIPARERWPFTLSHRGYIQSGYGRFGDVQSAESAGGRRDSPRQGRDEDPIEQSVCRQHGTD